ncbi:MAG: GIY-YIG nuclease family protein [Desulfatitalea sp.]
MDRKDLIRKYKETPRPAGIYRVRNTVSGRSLVGSSPDLPGIINRIRFQLEHGSHPDSELQKEWYEFGKDAFIFETLDQLAPSSDSGYDPSEDLRVLLQMWIEKLKE